MYFHIHSVDIYKALQPNDVIFIVFTLRPRKEIDRCLDIMTWLFSIVNTSKHCPQLYNVTNICFDFTPIPGKADTIQEFPKSSTLTPAKAMLPTQVAPTPATAQKLAAAALELTTQSSCLLTANNMQQLYTGHVLSQSVRTGGATSYTPTLQFHTKGGLTAGTKGMPVQPMSLTIVAPGAGVGLPQQPPLVQQTDPTHVVLQTDDISVVSEDTNSHPNILS